MIVRPSKEALETTIEMIEDSDKFGFKLVPANGELPEKLSGLRVIDMWGPWWGRAWKSKSPGSYNGKVWTCGVDIYPYSGFDDTMEAAQEFERIAGEHHTQFPRRSFTDDIFLRYHFPPEQQPPRSDGFAAVPYIVEFRVQTPGPIVGDGFEASTLQPVHKVRLLYPPQPRQKWWEVKEAAKLLEKYES